MSWFELIAERRIRDAQEEGAFDDLPGKGKPLDLESDQRVPPELRAAYRLMKDGQILPDWIQLAKEIRQREERWGERVESFSRRRAAQLEDECRGAEAARREERLDRLRDLFLHEAAEELRELNRMIERLNLIVPAVSQQRLRIDARARLLALEERFPRFQPLPPGLEGPWMKLIQEHRPPSRLANRMPRRSRRGSFG